jgi:hypothetical protein
MSKVDAERAMAVYRTFTRQTDQVVQYLSIARQFEHHTRVEVPKLKHAPVNLGKQLEEYLNDEDFEVHRRQYLAEQEVKKTGGSSSGSKLLSTTRKKEVDFPEPASNNPFPTASSSNAKTESKPQANKGPDPDLIDFFDSIEQNQTPLQVTQQPQQQMNAGFQQQQPTGMGFQPTNGFAPQPTGFPSNGAFQQQQQQPTGFGQQAQSQAPQLPQLIQPSFSTGFGGFSPQQGFQPSSLAPIPQDSVASFPASSPPAVQPIQTGQPQGLQPMATGTNPFRQSMLMAQQTGMPAAPITTSLSTPALSANPNRQSTNPFARNQQNTSPFSSTSSSPFQQPNQQVSSPPAPLLPAATGTNPFARNATQAPVQAPVQVPVQNQEQRPQTAGAGLVPQPTGSTNPFRHGAFVNHNTGMGWQHNQQPIGGGLDQLETLPVFPRPAQQTPWQQ